MLLLIPWTYGVTGQASKNCLLGISLLILILGLNACSQTPDEAQIQQQLDEIIEAIEARQSRVVLSKLADHFSGPNNQDKRQTYRFMVASFLRYKNVRVLRSSLPDIQIQGQDARVTFDVTLTGGNSMIPEHLRQYAVTTGWQKIDGDWLVMQADWTTK